MSLLNDPILNNSVLPDPITNDINASLICGDTVQTDHIQEKTTGGDGTYFTTSDISTPSTYANPTNADFKFISDTGSTNIQLENGNSLNSSIISFQTTDKVGGFLNFNSALISFDNNTGQLALQTNDGVDTIRVEHLAGSNPSVSFQPNGEKVKIDTTGLLVDNIGELVTNNNVSINDKLIIDKNNSEITASNVVNIENGSGPTSYTDGEDSLLRLAGGGSNATSPRASWYTQTQTRPIMQLLARNQIDEYLIFSGYYNGNVRSSDSGGTFQLRRTPSDDLRLEAGTSAEGLGVAMIAGLIIDNTGKIQLPNLSQDDTNDRILTYDNTDSNKVKWRDVSTINGGLMMSEGTYTPTFTNGTAPDDWDALPTFSNSNYTRIGDYVNVRLFGVNGNNDGIKKHIFYVSLPIARTAGNFTNSNQASGFFNNDDTTNASDGVVYSDLGSERVVVQTRFSNAISSIDISTVNFWYSLT